MKLAQVRSRFRGALLGAAIGDAIGAAWPLLDAPAWDERALLEHAPHRLAVTEITHRTAAMAASVAERWGLDLEQVRATAARSAAATTGDGQGATALLVLPVSLLAYHDLEIVAWLAQEASIAAGTCEATHDAGMLFACAVALLFQQPPDAAFVPDAFLAVLARQTAGTGAETIVQEIQAALLDQGPDGARRLAEGAASAQGTVWTALGALLVGAAQPLWFPDRLPPGPFVAVVRSALTLAGDRAVLGALAGTLAGAQSGEQAIPAVWREQLPEARPLLDLADALVEMAELGPTFRDLASYMAAPALRGLSYDAAG